MSEVLEAISNGKRVGRICYARDRILFTYDETWQEDRRSFPLSLSMPLTRKNHNDSVMRPFISGLLPDNNEVLSRWGSRFHVSPRNPFRLLSHVGEECAGAVQFIQPEAAERWLGSDTPGGIDWLTNDQLSERISDLSRDHSSARRLDDDGQFSLAGAQAKTGLYWDKKSEQWGIPNGSTPTTHILKPNVGAYDHYDLNEHFCLQLASRLGLQTAKSWTQEIGGISVIIVERFDRVRSNDQTIRIHQEDCCQALSRMPEIKYQNQGGPSAKEIFGLIRNHSSNLQEDTDRFLDAMIFNWLIGGTDAHSKNYGFLLGGAGQIRLAPLYDLSSCLPYPREIQIRKAKLAMKIGGEYHLYKIRARQWEKAADEWGLKYATVREHLVKMATLIPRAAAAVARTIEPGNGNIIPLLVEKISERAGECLVELQKA